jgi:hypothetical protein
LLEPSMSWLMLGLWRLVQTASSQPLSRGSCQGRLSFSHQLGLLLGAQLLLWSGSEYV